MRRIFAWADKRPRVRMLVYYRGFGDRATTTASASTRDSTRALRRRLDQVRFPAYAPAHATKPDRVARADSEGGAGATSAVSHSGPLG